MLKNTIIVWTIFMIHGPFQGMYFIYISSVIFKIF
jgi:hypothetical protein